MIHELRIYTVAAGGMRDYLDAAENIAVPVRGDRYGRLVGFWTGIVGSVNRVFNLWTHESLDTRARLRVELGQLPGWRNDYLPRVRPLMTEQTIRLMEAVVDVQVPAKHAVYEMRFFRARTGQGAALASALAQTVDRDRTLALWTTIAPDPNEVVQLCGFASADERLVTRASAATDVLDAHATHIERVESTLLAAASHSPLR